MSVNKVQLANGETIIDISDSTVTPETLAEGVTAHDASGEKITGTMKAGGASVQSDWNQTDETAADFIKNKPFGEVPTVILEEQELVYDPEAGVGVVEVLAPIQAGDHLTVVFDGESYECNVTTVEGLDIFGNAGLLGVGDDTGEPFVCMTQMGMVMVSYMDELNHTIQINGFTATKIPEKYLPKTTFYVKREDVYLYTDMSCTTKATMTDIPDGIDFKVALSSGMAVLLWGNVFECPSMLVRESQGYCSVNMMFYGEVEGYFTSEFTPGT